jgi:hypothetical protein
MTDVPLLPLLNVPLLPHDPDHSNHLILHFHLIPTSTGSLIDPWSDVPALPLDLHARSDVRTTMILMFPPPLDPALPLDPDVPLRGPELPLEPDLPALP